MAGTSIEIGEEIGAKRTFVWVIDWPGWCRSGKSPDLAREALITSVPRYAAVAEAAGLIAPAADDAVFALIASVGGGAGTDFGVPSVIIDADRRPTEPSDAVRLARIVEASWAVLNRAAASAPGELRKGPRGGGRDRDKMLAHVVEADYAYAREIGLHLKEHSWDDRPGIKTLRAAILEVIRTPSDGSPIADRKWTARYAARRIAWHALDHAWEMEDRSEPA